MCVWTDRDAYWYSEKMAKFIDFGRIKDAVALLDEMKFHHIQPTTPVYNTLLGGYSRAGDITQAMRLYNQMKKHGAKPEERTFSLLLSTLGNADLDSQVSLEKIEDLRAEMRKYGVSPNLFIQNSLLKVLQSLQISMKTWVLTLSCVLFCLCVCVVSSLSCIVTLLCGALDRQCQGWEMRSRRLSTLRTTVTLISSRTRRPTPSCSTLVPARGPSRTRSRC